MSSWSDILNEIGNTQSQYDYVRRQYVKKLSKLTNRNVITYYSGWLSKNNSDMTSINDSDMVGFMNCVHNMDCSKGLDLVLHTPGGFPDAAEAIVTYLRKKFNNDIRVIVPQLALSAGTMIACSAKEIIMGKQSSLGPIDPQFNGIPAYNIKMEFEEAKRDLLDNPANAQYWAIKLQQYPAAFMKTAIDAINLSDKLVREWLASCMFNDTDQDNAEIIDKIVSTLNEHEESKSHSRHFDADFCLKIGLKISMMEENNDLQDAILSMHHAYMITFNSTNSVKIIENQNNKSQITALNF